MCWVTCICLSCSSLCCPASSLCVLQAVLYLDPCVLQLAVSSCTVSMCPAARCAVLHGYLCLLQHHGVSPDLCVLQYAVQQLGAKELLVRGDSDLVIKQMKGVYRVVSEQLKLIYDEARELLQGCSSVTFEHVYRCELVLLLV